MIIFSLPCCIVEHVALVFSENCYWPRRALSSASAGQLAFIAWNIMWLTEIAARLLKPVKSLHHVGSDSQLQQCQESGGSFKSLKRNSFEINKQRIVTRRCSLENAHVHQQDMAYHEELHTALPREDSIKLAKRRMSHDHPHGADEVDLEWDHSADQSRPHLVRWGGAVAVPVA